VDAFGWEDYALNSALGREDGDVYRALLDMAQVCVCCSIIAPCHLAIRCCIASSTRWHGLVVDAVRVVVPSKVLWGRFSGWEDYALNSALGRSDGDAYRALLDMAQVCVCCSIIAPCRLAIRCCIASSTCLHGLVTDAVRGCVSLKVVWGGLCTQQRTGAR
jgi:hypothetical protein